MSASDAPKPAKSQSAAARALANALREAAALARRLRPPAFMVTGAFYLFLIVAGAIFVHTIFQGRNLHDMSAAISSLGAPALARAGAFVVATYAVMCVMEALALRDARIGALGPSALVVPLLANAVSMGTGFGAVSGAGLRVRLYARWRIGPANALFIASSVTLMSIAGGALVAALGLIVSPQLLAPTLHLAPFFAQFIGALLLGGFLVALALAGDQPRLFAIAGRSFRAPRASGWAGRLAAGAADWLCSAAVLYALLPPQSGIDYLSFATLFAAVHLMAMATGLPGGIGAFDLIMLVLVRPEAVPLGAMAAALIAYRVIAFATPIALGAVGLALFEAHGLRAQRTRPNSSANRIVHWTAQAWAKWAAPGLLGAARPRVARTVGQLFSPPHARSRISLRALTGGGPVLIVAPHPDDETLGCGGLLAACAAHGVQAHVAVLTDGRHSHAGSRNWTSARLIARRAGETRAALTQLGLPARSLHLLNLGDGALIFSSRLRNSATAALARLVSKTGARRVFVTWPHDPHPDHIAAAAIAASLQRTRPRLRIVHYPVWGRFLPPTLKLRDRRWRVALLDVRQYRAVKRRALSCYRSQTTRLIDDAPIAHRLTRAQIRAFLGPDEIYLI